MKIIQATIENLEQLLRLFDSYSKFYKQSTNKEIARYF